MSTARHIAFVSPRFAEGATVGGAETLLRRLADRLAARGCEVTFLTTCADNHFTWANTLPAGTRKVGDIEVINFPVDEDRDVGLFHRIQTSMSHGTEITEQEEQDWIANSVNSRALYDHLRDKGDQYDRIILGPYLFGITYFASAIHPEKSLLIPCLHDEPFAYLGIMKKMFEQAGGLLFNTEPERDLARRLFSLREDRCTVVGMGLDAFDADASAFAKRHHLEQPYLLYSGRREPMKGTPLLIDYVNAFRQRTGHDMKLVFTGSGPIDPPDEMLPHILDVGFVSEQEKHEAMAGALAFCHPSQYESLGIVLLESWLARTPALVHAGCDVLRYQCQSSNAGFWFRFYPEFEDELKLLIDNAALRTAMGEAGRAFVMKEYSWDAVEQRLLDALGIRQEVE